jgi:hypothetical protein
MAYDVLDDIKRAVLMGSKIILQHGRVTHLKKSAEAKSQQKLLLIRLSMVVKIHNNIAMKAYTH